jgi:endonuclease/exonuclease/phosphatase family metal-dependent hydrolase
MTSVAPGVHTVNTDTAVLRVATYNIHKGVCGLGPGRRLEIHNLSASLHMLDADVLFLQEVSHVHKAHARRFQQAPQAWPALGQADFLAAQGYHQVAYRSNAHTRHGEHGNALLSRWPLGAVAHVDISDHRFEQRGLLHVPFEWQGQRVHAVVVHLGLIHASRWRQVQRIAAWVHQQIAPDEPLIVAGDFNDWGEQLDTFMKTMGLLRAQSTSHGRVPRTFPSRFPVWALDRIYTRGFRCTQTFVPRGRPWQHMSDHLPLSAQLILD